ncbi:hypothetical protein Poli38472_004945 [Pythium oligandrum]|uniref:Uncharacterized protein n=1 Tax=Pythium oligandrum TaxID=41045 RepID=A0A8K1CBF3_PYTOL|nr:hypothetical protein Poli38472_004945 [Pythium oligandrum]|eukprot:TMW59876.1 hypothetical protein Poli38472_004945 [Pythium oligandrum]
MRSTRRAPKTKPPQKNPPRERPQAELRHLKTLVEGLEREQSALELNRHEAIAREEEEAGKDQNLTSWCREARQELKQRWHVERINARLRQTVDEQIKVAKGLTDLLSRQLSLLSTAYASVQESHDSTTSDVFLKDVDAAYRMTDVVMEAIDWGASRQQPQLVMEMATQFDHPLHDIIPNEGVPSTWQHLIQFLQCPPFVADELVVQDQWLIVRYRRNYWFCSREVRAERLLAELKHLRALVDELERERSHLEKKRQEEDERIDEPWRTAIRTECTRRKDAESVNQRLRNAVEEQIQVVTGLRDLINQQMECVTTAYATIQLRHLSLGLGLFDAFLKDIQVGYQAMNHFMAPVDWSSRENSRPWRVQTRVGQCNGQAQLVLEAQKQLWQPSVEFSPDLGDFKLWGSFNMHFQTSNFDIQELVVRHNYLAVQYRHFYPFRDQEIPVCTWLTMKRYIEKSREVRVWRSKTTMNDSNLLPILSVFVDVVGWTVIEPESLGGDSDGVMILVCAHVIPGFVDEQTGEVVSYESPPPRLGDLVSCVLISLQEGVARVDEDVYRAE